MKKLWILFLITLCACTSAPTEEVIEPSASSTPSAAAETLSDEITYTVQEDSFTENDITIAGTLYVPSAANNIAVIMSHGIGGDQSDVAIFAQWFAEQGFTVYTFDFAGGGVNTQSTGEMTDMTLTSEEDNLKSVIAHVKETQNVSSLWLLGQSQGGLISSNVAIDMPNDVNGLLLVYPAFSIPDMVREMYSSIDAIPDTDIMFYFTVSKDYFVSAYTMDAYEGMESYSNPVFISHGDSDTIIPYESSVKACSLFQDCTLYTVEGASHGYIESVAREVTDEMISFVFDNTK